MEGWTMGFNSTLFVLNDRLHDIAEYKNLGEQLRYILGGCPRPGQKICDGMTVVECHHADYTAIIAAGGNCASLLGTLCDAHHHTPEARVNVLRDLADAMGFDLVAKPKRRRRA
jgi:hypothetical protein